MHSTALLSISTISALVGTLQWLAGLGGIHMRQSGPFSSARAAARHCISKDSADAVQFEAAKATIQTAETSIGFVVDCDFMFTASFFGGPLSNRITNGV
jgi:hypothetical protein